MKASKDPGTMKFSRATISDFSYESAYEVLSNVCCFVFCQYVICRSSLAAIHC